MYRWNNYKSNGCKYHEYGTCMQQHLFKHFSEEWHHCFLEDVSISLIDKTDPSNSLQRENYWRSTLKTMAPWRLNVEDCVWNSVLLHSYTGFERSIYSKDLIYRNDFVPIIIVTIFITIIAVAVFITLIFSLFLSPGLCWCSSCHDY